jgi:hypothetical protein
MPQQTQTAKGQAQLGISTLKRLYHGGHLGAQAASVKPDWDRSVELQQQYCFKVVQ